MLRWRRESFQQNFRGPSIKWKLCGGTSSSSYSFISARFTDKLFQKDLGQLLFSVSYPSFSSLYCHKFNGKWIMWGLLRAVTSESENFLLNKIKSHFASLKHYRDSKNVSTFFFNKWTVFNEFHCQVDDLISDEATTFNNWKQVKWIH